MMMINMIYIQLFYILFFSKTFGRADVNEIKITIQWRHLPGMEILNSKLSEWKWNKRFELTLYRVDRQTGRVILPPIASGKSGHYDLAMLKIEPQAQQIGIQNIKGKELAESSRNRKGKGIVQQDLFELEIKMISPENFNIQQQTIVKRLNDLPNEKQILICIFDPNIECSNHKEKNHLPIRKIFFEMMQKFETLQIQRILCIKTGIFFQPSQLNRQANGMAYEGQVCPSDEYTIYFSVIGGRRITIHFSFICDEAINVLKINHYQLWFLDSNGNSKCKLKLFEDNIEDGSNSQNPQIMQTISNISSSAVANSQQMKLMGKNISITKPSMKPQSHLPNKTLLNMTNLSATNEQFENIVPGQQYPQPPSHPSHPFLIPSYLYPSMAAQLVPHFAEQLLQHAFTSAEPNQSQPNLRNFQPGTIPSAHSDLRSTPFANPLLNLQRQFSNPRQGGQNSFPTNFQPSQIAGTSGQLQQQYLPQHIDLGHSSSQIAVRGQQIQPSGMFPMQFENPPQQHESSSIQGHRSTGGGARFRWRPSGSSNLPTKDEQTKQLLKNLEDQPMSSHLQMDEEQEKHDDEQTKLGLGLMSGQKRGPNERDEKDKDEEGPSKKSKNDLS